MLHYSAIRKQIITVAGLVLLYLCYPSDAVCNARILVVHSYHPGHPWVQGVTDGLIGIFKAHKAAYRIFHMDTKRRTNEAWKKESARLAKKMVAEYDPQVIIAVDDNAQQYFVKDYIDQSAIQFVFCGVNADPGQYGYPASNVTGLFERTYPGQTLQTLRAILPGVRRVAVVSDDSTTSELVLPRIKKDAATAFDDFNPAVVSYEQPSTFSQWQKVIMRLDQDPLIDAILIPLYHTVREDGTQISMDPSEVLRWTLQQTKKPLAGLWPFLVEDGGFLSVTVDSEEHGRVAAQMALEILGGKRSGQIPMAINKNGKVMVNLKNNTHLFINTSIKIDQVADYVIR